VNSFYSASTEHKQHIEPDFALIEFEHIPGKDKLKQTNAHQYIKKVYEVCRHKSSTFRLTIDEISDLYNK
jgi:hypothetical protein